ncbi:hypothetical protein QR680_011001 [Steinernema hermaphroditum]|uniref:Uncharacterized protein n=1 Tax=Steinernema hermaphroditum TaxID=289476 RepID=A0AA39IQU7_9BILA|nr:hypothetical protein QR680_011001 [Steinernema hermaphroditum]
MIGCVHLALLLCAITAVSTISRPTHLKPCDFRMFKDSFFVLFRDGSFQSPGGNYHVLNGDTTYDEFNSKLDQYEHGRRDSLMIPSSLKVFYTSQYSHLVYVWANEWNEAHFGIQSWKNLRDHVREERTAGDMAREQPKINISSELGSSVDYLPITDPGRGPFICDENRQRSCGKDKEWVEIVNNFSGKVLPTGRVYAAAPAWTRESYFLNQLKAGNFKLTAEVFDDDPDYLYHILVILDKRYSISEVSWCYIRKFSTHSAESRRMVILPKDNPHLGVYVELGMNLW